MHPWRSLVGMSFLTDQESLQPWHTSRVLFLLPIGGWKCDFWPCFPVFAIDSNLTIMDSYWYGTINQINIFFPELLLKKRTPIPAFLCNIFFVLDFCSLGRMGLFIEPSELLIYKISQHLFYTVTNSFPKSIHLDIFIKMFLLVLFKYTGVTFLCHNESLCIPHIIVELFPKDSLFFHSLIN